MLMAIKKSKRKINKLESDSTYYLKIVMYLLIGSFWIWVVNPGKTAQIPVPVGFIFGMFFAAHDHFRIDRKIEYAILTVGMFIGFWANTGLYISL